jgi:hypothetical protein
MINFSLEMKIKELIYASVQELFATLTVSVANTPKDECGVKTYTKFGISIIDNPLEIKIKEIF